MSSNTEYDITTLVTREFRIRDPNSSILSWHLSLYLFSRGS